MLLSAIKREVYIGPDYVRITTLTKSIYLKFEDILGYTTRLESRSLTYYIIPTDNPQTWIRISGQVGDPGELTTWIKNHLTDQTWKLARTEEVLKDSRYGSSRKKRQRFLRRADRTALIFNVAIPVLALLTVFFQAHLGAGLLVIPLFPIAGIALVLLFKGLVEFHFTPLPPHRSLGLGLVSAPLFFLLTACIHYPHFSNKGLAPVFIPMALLLTAVMLTVSGRSFWVKPNSYPSLLVVIYASCLMAYGSIRYLNCYLDRARPKDVSLTINGKAARPDKRGTLYYAVSFQTPNAIDLGETEVSLARFSSLREGDTMHVMQRPGAFGISWFELGNQ